MVPLEAAARGVSWSAACAWPAGSSVRRVVGSRSPCSGSRDLRRDRRPAAISTAVSPTSRASRSRRVVAPRRSSRACSAASATSPARRPCSARWPSTYSPSSSGERSRSCRFRQRHPPCRPGGARTAANGSVGRGPAGHARRDPPPARPPCGADPPLCVAGFGLSMIVFGLSTSFVISFIALFMSGVTDGVSVIIRNTVLRVLSPEAHSRPGRGRELGLRRRIE